MRLPALPCTSDSELSSQLKPQDFREYRCSSASPAPTSTRLIQHFRTEAAADSFPRTVGCPQHRGSTPSCRPVRDESQTLPAFQLPVCRRPLSWRPPLYTAPCFVLYRKNGVESATQEQGCDLGRDYQHRERLGTTMTTPTPLLTSSGSCPWPFPWPVHPPACPGNGSVA